MEIKSETTGDIVWMKISGRMLFDPTLFRLRELIHHGIESGIKKYVIDVSEVPHIDSQGCGELISAHASIQRVSGLLVLVNPCERVRILWSRTKLDSVLKIFDTVEEARKSVAG